MLLDVSTSMDVYGEGFFGYGEIGDFKYYSLRHFVPIILMIAAIILTYIFREKIRSFKYEANVRYILAFVMIIVEMSFYWRLLYTGNPYSNDMLKNLPVQVCTWSAIFTVFLLTTKSDLVFQYLGYVSLSLGLFPFVMPAVIVTTGPTYYRYYQFFLEHIIPVYSVFYIMFVHGYKLKLNRIWVPFVFLFPMSLLAVYLNHIIPGANYFYLGTRTQGDSIVNIMPDSVVAKFFIYGAVAIAGFFAVYGLNRLGIYLKKKYDEKKALNNTEELA